MQKKHCDLWAVIKLSDTVLFSSCIYEIRTDEFEYKWAINNQSNSQ